MHLEVVDIEAALPYPSEYFDCITALDILEHTKNVEENLRKIVRTLKTGGHLIITLPMDAWPRKFFTFLDRDEMQVSMLKEGELVDIVKRNDLRILNWRRYCPFPMVGSIPPVPAQVELILIKQ